MSFPFAFHPEALDELLETADWYDLQRPGLGDEFLEAVKTTLERAVPLVVVDNDFPLRRVLLRLFPYTVIFLADPQRGQQILSVGHQHRDPDYWKHRLPESHGLPEEPDEG